jgi:23S rRNA (adenine2503-C2)-methyltransferase
LAQEAITLSTVGVVPAIRRFTAEGHAFRLIVSLTSTVPARRAELLPTSRHTPVEEIAAALREHAAARGDRVTVAWVLLGGHNHDAVEIEGLRRLFTGVPLRLNLIDLNPTGDSRFRAATDAERHAFLDALQVLAVPVVRRYSGGQSRHAACGMLAGKRCTAPALVREVEENVCVRVT